MSKKLRGKRGSHIRRYEEMLSSPAYRDLKPPARCLLEEFQRLYRRGRNGDLSISTRNAAVLLNVSETTAEKAFYDLVEHGFLKLSKHEMWQERKAREWYLTFEEGKNGKHPTDEWRVWEPDNHFPVPYRRKGKNPDIKKGAELP